MTILGVLKTKKKNKKPKNENETAAITRRQKMLLTSK